MYSQRVWWIFVCSLALVLVMDLVALPDTVTPIWSDFYDLGLLEQRDRPTSMVVDQMGNVYVTGWSLIEYAAPYNSADYATVKYDTNGNLLWTVFYDGLAPSVNEDDDKSSSIAVDGEGNVYITGKSTSLDGDYDFATIKYDSEGTELWVARYDGYGEKDIARKISLDSDGNVYVIGVCKEVSFIAYYYCTLVKYDSEGNQLWVAETDCVNNASADFALSETGDAFVVTTDSTGADDFLRVLKYSQGGNQIWYKTYFELGTNISGAKLALGNQNTVHVSGTIQLESIIAHYLTIKYDQDGNELWTAQYEGPLDRDIAYALAVGADGDVYVTGKSSGIESGADFVTVRYDESGTQLWEARYSSYLDNLSVDTVRDIILDERGDVYICGYVPDYDDYRGNLVTIKYNSDGGEEWIIVQDAKGDGTTVPPEGKIQLDSDGNIYAMCTKEVDSSPFFYDIFLTVKYGQEIDGTVSCNLNCQPESGTIPFLSQMTVYLSNRYDQQTRRIAGWINVVIASGQSYSNWKSGWTNMSASSSYITSWNHTIPALGSVLGDNVFTLLAEDITPSPFNQPPYPPSGDTATDICTVTGIAP